MILPRYRKFTVIPYMLQNWGAASTNCSTFFLLETVQKYMFGCLDYIDIWQGAL